MPKSKDSSWLNEHKWPGLQSVFSIERIVEARGYSSRDASAKQLMELAREHWKIESMHWLLDVTFSGDDCRFLSENAHKTMNALRKFALAVHKNFLAAHRKKSSYNIVTVKGTAASRVFCRLKAEAVG